MNREKNPEVVVVGAGPTGLALATALARWGVAVRILDKSAARSDHSKALGVQAGTLEALEAFFGEGLVQAMVQRGHPTKHACFHFGKKPGVAIDLSVIPSRYNFILVLEQSETERFLEAELNAQKVTVDRETELVSLEETKDGVCSRIQLPDGRIEEVTSRFIVGCDGAHSIVRKELGIPFTGGVYSGDFLLADTELEWPWDYGGVRTFIQPKGVVAFFPMRGEHRYRVILLKGATASRSEELTLDEVQEAVDRLAPERVRLSHASWLSRFRVSHRIVDRLRKGSGFLAGDAAHIHSPVGGQGMNTGIQEGLALANQLAQVLRFGASPSVLDLYESKRLPVARRVLHSTDVVSKVGVLAQNRLTVFLRETLIRSLLKSRAIQKVVLTGLSQVREARKLSPYGGTNFQKSP